MALERVDVMKQALNRIGEDLPDGFADLSSDDEAADPLVQTYETRVENALGVYPWRCTLATILLSQGTPAALSPWTYAHPLPAARLGSPRKVWKSTTLTDDNLLKLRENGLDASNNLAVLSNEAVIVAEIQRRAAPIAWDATLRELIIQDLMSAYALQVRQDRAQMLELNELAWGSTDGRLQGQYFRAKQAEAVPQASRVAALENGPLVNARR